MELITKHQLRALDTQLAFQQKYHKNSIFNLINYNSIKSNKYCIDLITKHELRAFKNSKIFHDSNYLPFISFIEVGSNFFTDEKMRLE